MAAAPVFRFAPSPNGYLHLGHALSALLNAEAAHAAGGLLLLRIDDIDETRCRPEFETAIHEDLAWLGIEFEPPARRQSEHLADHRAALTQLDAMGLIYPSFESRAEIAQFITARDAAQKWPRDADGAPLYPGRGMLLTAQESERRMAAGAPFALRLDMTAALKRAGPQSWDEAGTAIAADPAAWGDVVLARKETPTSYHLGVVVDDAQQGVTHVVRGADLFAATAVHRVLQALLGLKAPVYRHHRLIPGADGRKLSKSTRATALRELRAQGVTPDDVRRTVRL